MLNKERILGEEGVPFSIEHIPQLFEVYANEHLYVLEPKETILFNLEQGLHSHSDFEFLISLSTMPFVAVGRENLQLHQNSLLPINSEQPHGAHLPMNNLRFISLSIAKSKFNEISQCIYGSPEVVFFNKPYILDTVIINLINQFKREYIEKQAGYSLILETLTTQLITYFLRNFTSNRSSDPLPDLKFIAKDYVLKAIERLRESYNDSLTLEELAKTVSLSPYHFIRVFKEETGKTPFVYLLDIKIEKAMEMLKYHRLKSVTEVCYSCGFKNLSHFTTVFKQKVGVSPSEYRKMVK